MRRLARTFGPAAIAVALVGAGLAGAYSYGRNYELHRGFAAPARVSHAGSGRLELVRFYSRALHRNADYLAYLPPHYTSRRHYPVYYLLHGTPGQPSAFVDVANMDVRLDNQLTLGRARPLILVYPDGRIGGNSFSDSEWANTPSGDFASYVIEVMRNVDRRFSTIARRQDRVIGGYSAGAYGAMNIALHHLSAFANVQSWSGYFTQTATGVFAKATRVALAYNSPLDYVGRLRRELARFPLRVYMYVGRGDPSSAQQLPMARALLAAGAQAQYALVPGGHDWSVWYPRMNQMLDLASSDVRHPPSFSPARLSPLASPPSGQPAPSRRHRNAELRLIGALLLALVSAALINLGFVLQHRGHEGARSRRRAGLSAGFREPFWLLGQATGWIGFLGQIVAVALAPLTLVQAFSAGSLALSVPVAARVLGHRVARRQLIPIAVIAVSLMSLPLGLGPAHGHLQPGLLIASALLMMVAGGLLAARGGAAALAVAAGALYGAADAAIKAASIGLRFHGAGILTGWTLLAALCTLGGFLAFQAALRAGDPIQPLSLMNAFTALAAIVLGVAAFGEPLGSSTATTLLHAAAIAAVLLCVRPLADAQQRLVGAAELKLAPALARRTPVRRARHSAPIVARRLGSSLLGFVSVLVGAVAALGLLYELRQLRLFMVGPRVSDALPLLQLAGFDGQPLARVIASAVLAGLVLGLALIRLPRRPRVVIVGVLALALMVIGSDASYAVARNLRLDQVLLHRTPGLGPWLQALLLAAGSAVAGPALSTRLAAVTPRVTDRRRLASILAGAIGVIAAGALIAPGGHAHAQVRARPRPRVASHSTSVHRLPPATLRGALDATLRQTAVRAHAPAATAALVKCGRVVWADATGVIDLRSNRPAGNDSLFILNSAAKTIVASMIMKEIQAGHLSLSTKLSRFYPRLPNAAGISVRMLLNMTSGLPDYLRNPRIKWMIAHRPRHRWTVDQVLTGLGSGLGTPAFAPGRAYQYSDTNYIVLGAILERITGSSIQADLQQLITQPLQLTSPTFVPTPAAIALIAHPYLLQRNGSLTSRWIPGFGISSAVWGPVFTDGGLAASALDLAKFANALLAGRLVSPAALHQMIHLGRGNYGFGIQGRSFDGRFWLGHYGVFGGFEVEDWTDPKRHLTFAIATNVQSVSGGLISDRIWQAIAQAYDRRTAQAATCRPPPVYGRRRSRTSHKAKPPLPTT
jgi:D-alanyl-D-alanine carboxypeptidase